MRTQPSEKCAFENAEKVNQDYALLQTNRKFMQKNLIMQANKEGLCRNSLCTIRSILKEIMK